MISAKRHIISLFLAAVYLLITISPLTPLAMKSPRLAHAITGECSGDCNICGCSPERRASHTCCCWQKKLKQNRFHKDDDETTPACCKNKSPRKKV